jgi:hypothetical protein
MSERSNLEQPKQIRDAKDERQDGRPTHADHTTGGTGMPNADHPTVAPEEEGGSPTTEHGPGGDL